MDYLMTERGLQAGNFDRGTTFDRIIRLSNSLLSVPAWLIKKPDASDVYYGEYPIDLSDPPLLLVAKASGKYIGGSIAEDSRVDDYIAQARSRGVKTGVYHFLRPNSIIPQADKFLGVWDRNKGTDARPVLDVEVDPATEGISKAQWTDQIKAWIDYVSQRTGYYPIVYSSIFFWGFTTLPDWAADFDCWPAWYPYWPDDFATIPSNYILPKFRRWAMWQYAQDGRSQGYPLNDYNLINDWFEAELNGTAPPPPPPPTVEITNYTNGVSTQEGNKYNSDYKTYILPFDSIRDVSIVADGNCHTIDSIEGDLVVNMTPSEVGACTPNMAVRNNGVTLFPYKDFNPYIGWVNNKAFVDHQQNNMNVFPVLSQGYRYIVKGGVKGQTSTAWNNREPRCLFGRFPDGSTIIVSSQGRSGEDIGWTLHEAAEYLLSLGVDWAIDMDSGKSVGSILTLADGKKIWFSGTGDNEPLPSICIINFKEPLSIDTTTPPGEIMKINEFKDGKRIRIWKESDKSSPRELFTDTGKRLIPRRYANRREWMILPDWEIGFDRPKNRPAVLRTFELEEYKGGDYAGSNQTWRQNFTEAMQRYWFELCCLQRFGVLSHLLNLSDLNWIMGRFAGGGNSITASDTFLNNRAGTDTHKDYINNNVTGRENAKVELLLCVGHGINVLNTLTGKVVTNSYNQMMLKFDTIDPTNLPEPSLDTPGIIYATTIHADHVSHFPQLQIDADGCPTPYPLFLKPGTVPFYPLNFLKEIK